MLIRINDRSGVPLHSQIAGQVRLAIARGEAVDRERLPSVRRLADSLGVNMHTVLRAYRELEAEGVLELRQGRGATVRNGGRQRANELVSLVDHVMNYGKKTGLTPMQLASLVQGQL